MVDRKVTETFVFEGIEIGITKMSDFGKKTEKSAKGLEKFRKRLSKVGAGFVKLGKLTATAGAAILGVAGAAAAFGLDLIKAAERTELLRNKLKILAPVGLNVANVLARMRAETKKTVSEIDLMDALVKALLTKLPLTEDQFGLIAEAAIKLGIIMGTTTADGMDLLISAMIKQEKEAIEAVGLVIKLGATYEKYAKSLGTTASKLTDAQKSMAFLNEVLDQSRVKAKALGEVDVNLAIQIQQVTTRMADMRAEMGKTIAETGLGASAIDFLNESLDAMSKWFKDNSESIKNFFSVLPDLLRAVVDGVIPIVGLMGEIVASVVLLDKSFAAIVARAEANRAAKEALKRAEQAGPLTAQETGRAIESLRGRDISQITDPEELATASVALRQRRRNLIIGGQQEDIPQDHPIIRALKGGVEFTTTFPFIHPFAAGPNLEREEAAQAAITKAGDANQRMIKLNDELIKAVEDQLKTVVPALEDRLKLFKARTEENKQKTEE